MLVRGPLRLADDLATAAFVFVVVARRAEL